MGDLIKIPLSDSQRLVITIERRMTSGPILILGGTYEIVSESGQLLFEGARAELAPFGDGVSGILMGRLDDPLPSYEIDHLGDGLHRITEVDVNDNRVRAFDLRSSTLQPDIFLSIPEDGK